MRALLLTGLLTLAGLTAAWGIPIPTDLIDVPIDRIVANLEARLAKDPKNARAHHALARAHGIAYAQAEASITLSRPAWGPEKPPPDETQLADHPFPPSLRAGRRADPAVARRHLEQAVAHYREATRLDPRNLPAALGYGWTLDLSGEKLTARGQYGAVLRQAVQEQSLYIAREAGTYLMRLLDPRADLLELAQLKGTLAAVEKLIKDDEAKPRPVTPIVVPLIADASFDELVARDAAVPFDLDGSGLPRRWQWITPRAGWLVYEGTGERGVDSGTRLIGSRTFWIFWSDGYAAMAALDDDGDGQLSGGELPGLAIWQDANSNGVTEAGEVRGVREWGIVALSCAHLAHPEGFLYSPQGAAFADGSVRPTYDWVASSVPANQGPQAMAIVPAAVALMLASATLGCGALRRRPWSCGNRSGLRLRRDVTIESRMATTAVRDHKATTQRAAPSASSMSPHHLRPASTSRSHQTVQPDRFEEPHQGSGLHAGFGSY